jgi:hypothetical protein
LLSQARKLHITCSHHWQCCERSKQDCMGKEWVMCLKYGPLKTYVTHSEDEQFEWGCFTDLIIKGWNTGIAYTFCLMFCILKYYNFIYT